MHFTPGEITKIHMFIEKHLDGKRADMFTSMISEDSDRGSTTLRWGILGIVCEACSASGASYSILTSPSTRIPGATEFVIKRVGHKESEEHHIGYVAAIRSLLRFLK